MKQMCEFCKALIDSKIKLGDDSPTWLFCAIFSKMMPFCKPWNLQNGFFFFSFSHFWARVTRPMNPISLPSTPQNSTSAPMFWCTETPFPHTPNHHLGYPISPFGVYFRHICPHRTAPRCPIWLLRFSLQKFVSFLSFRFIMFLRNSLGWIKYIL